jgi:hypothetical protein
VDPEEKFIVRHRLDKQVSATTDIQTTTEELLGTIFSVRSVQSGYEGREMSFGSAVCS